jgi:hypothetical protein
MPCLGGPGDAFQSKSTPMIQFPIATWALAFAWEPKQTVLITMWNTQFIHKEIPIAMAICSDS